MFCEDETVEMPYVDWHLQNLGVSHICVFRMAYAGFLFRSAAQAYL